MLAFPILQNSQKALRQKCTGDDIEVAVSIQIAGQGPMHAGHPRQEVIPERETSLVLEPANAVAGLGIVTVERIAVGAVPKRTFPPRAHPLR